MARASFLLVLGFAFVAGAAPVWTYDPKWPAASPDSLYDPTGASRPTGITFDASCNHTFVVYRQKESIATETMLELDEAGAIVRKFGLGAVAYAHDITVDPTTNSLYVTDIGASLVSRFDRLTGELLGPAIGEKGMVGHGLAPLLLGNVSHLAHTPDGALFVTDGDSLGTPNPLANHRLMRLNASCFNDTCGVEWAVGTDGTTGDDDEFCDPHSAEYDPTNDWIWVRRARVERASVTIA